VVKDEEQTKNTGEIVGPLGAINQTVAAEAIKQEKTVARISVTRSDDPMAIKWVNKVLEEEGRLITSRDTKNNLSRSLITTNMHSTAIRNTKNTQISSTTTKCSRSITLRLITSHSNSPLIMAKSSTTDMNNIIVQNNLNQSKNSLKKHKLPQSSSLKVMNQSNNTNRKTQ